MTSDPPPSVAIDGEKIRRIREAGRLTQLYVAKVVNVTTDTVSRWENNRYPTIRRDNALKLAEALEVELEQILKAEEPETCPAEPVVPRRSWTFPLLLLGVLLLAGVGAAWFFAIPEPVAHSGLVRVQRFLPHQVAAGTRVPVHLVLEADPRLTGLILRENFPPGWILVESDPSPTSLDNSRGSVRWMTRHPQQLTQIVYLLQAPKTLSNGDSVQLRGEVVANPEGQKMSMTISGESNLQVAPYHWADENANSRIDDAEILDASDLVDLSTTIHFGWDELEALWDAGSYRFDDKTHQFVPQKTPLTPDP